jgi:hypothetical protein
MYLFFPYWDGWLLRWQYMKSDETPAGQSVRPPISDQLRNPGDPIGRHRQGTMAPLFSLPRALPNYMLDPKSAHYPLSRDLNVMRFANVQPSNRMSDMAMAP